MNNKNRSQLCASFSLLMLSALSPLAFSQSGQPIVGVGQMVASTPGANPDAFEAMVETQLIETQKFRVIERAQLNQILSEKVLGQAGITNSGQTVSGVQGVDYLIYGTITKLGQDTQATAINGSAFGRVSGFGRFGGFATSSSHIVMAVDLRITDAHTGEIRYVGTVEEQVSSGGATRVGGIGVGSRASDPLADVQRLTAKSIVAQLTTSIYPIKVITKEANGDYVLNYGSSVLTVGDELGVFVVGQSFKDPDTGKILGAEETQVGLLKISDTESQFSKAILVNGAAGAGDVVKRLPSGAAAHAASSRGPALP